MKKWFFAAILFSLSLSSCQKQDVQTQGRAKLDDATIQLISCWVQNGSLE